VPPPDRRSPDGRGILTDLQGQIKKCPSRGWPKWCRRRFRYNAASGV